MSSEVDIIIFGAHPDDQEMAMGGTMIKFAEAGYKILSVSLTRSQMSTHGTVESREKEFKAAADYLGCDSLLMDFMDSEVENTPAARKLIARIIRERKPKIVFAPYHTNNLGDLGGIANVDHYATGSLVRDAVKMARLEKAVPDVEKHTVDKLYFYMLPRNVEPTLVVDVSDEIEKFKELLSSYQSQLEIKYQSNEIEHMLLTWRAALGTQIGVKFAEGFSVDMHLKMKPSTFFEV